MQYFNDFIIQQYDVTSAGVEGNPYCFRVRERTPATSGAAAVGPARRRRIARPCLLQALRTENGQGSLKTRREKKSYVFLYNNRIFYTCTFFWRRPRKRPSSSYSKRFARTSRFVAVVRVRGSRDSIESKTVRLVIPTTQRLYHGIRVMRILCVFPPRFISVRVQLQVLENVW